MSGDRVSADQVEAVEIFAQIAGLYAAVILGALALVARVIVWWRDR